MPLFRKKPIVITAERLTWSNWSRICDFVSDSSFGGGTFINSDGKSTDSQTEIIGLFINTLEGEMLATQGDWIIKGVNDEFYPCKPDIFEKTYESVE